MGGRKRRNACVNGCGVAGLMAVVFSDTDCIVDFLKNRSPANGRARQALLGPVDGLELVDPAAT